MSDSTGQRCEDAVLRLVDDSATAAKMPALLDGCCCEGGASRGYDRAGFRVEGVDLFKSVDKRGGFTRSRYPYPSHEADVVAFIREHGHRYDAFHVSPPCQHASAGTRSLRLDGREYPRLIEPVREALIETGKRDV